MPELECYDTMLTRLFKQELEQIVMGYECYRIALLRERDRKKPKTYPNVTQHRVGPQFVQRQPSVVSNQSQASHHQPSSVLSQSSQGQIGAPTQGYIVRVENNPGHYSIPAQGNIVRTPQPIVGNAYAGIQEPAAKSYVTQDLVAQQGHVAPNRTTQNIIGQADPSSVSYTVRTYSNNQVQGHGPNVTGQVQYQRPSIPASDSQNMQQRQENKLSSQRILTQNIETKI